MEAADPAPLEVGSRLGHYVITERIARGGMGTVYKALEPALERYVAIKVLHTDQALDPTAQNNFLEEARAVAALRHNNIVPLYFVGEEGGQNYFAMAYIEGQTLEDWVVEERFLNGEWAKWFLGQAIAALDYASRFGIIHLDVKPSNFLVDADNIVMLTDFGVAQRQRHLLENEEKELLGTPSYASPEHILQNSPDLRTDVYCLGATLYHLMSGRPPFEYETVEELCRAHVMEPFPEEKALKLGVPSGWVALIWKMMEKKPEDRFQTYEELRHAMEDVNNFRHGHSGPVAPASSRMREVPRGDLSLDNLYGLLTPALMGQDRARFAVRKTYSLQDSEAHLTRRNKILSLNAILTPMGDLLQTKEEGLSELMQASDQLPTFATTLDELVRFMNNFTDLPAEDLPERLELVGLTRSKNLALTALMLNQQPWQGKRPLDWSGLWQHQMACGLLLEMLYDMLDLPASGWEYAAGLLHDTGKILMSELFPNQYIGALMEALETDTNLQRIEEESFGMNHFELLAAWMELNKVNRSFYSIVGSLDEVEEFEEQGISSRLPDLGFAGGSRRPRHLRLLPHGVASIKHLVQELGIGYSGDAWMEQCAWPEHPSTLKLWEERRNREVSWSEFLDFFQEGCRDFPELTIAREARPPEPQALT
ncbi:MAG: protein kinase [Verrucomicrobiota bacterium]